MFSHSLPVSIRRHVSAENQRYSHLSQFGSRVSGVCLGCLSGRWSVSVTSSQWQRFRPAASKRRGALISGSVCCREFLLLRYDILMRRCWLWRRGRKKKSLGGSEWLQKHKEMMLTVLCVQVVIGFMQTKSWIPFIFEKNSRGQLPSGGLRVCLRVIRCGR